MKRVNLSEVENNPTPRPSGDLGAQISHILACLDDMAKIQAEHADMAADIKKIWERLNAVEALAAKAAQYEKDHNELHRNMATMQSKKDAESGRAVADAVKVSQTSIANAVTQQSDTLMASMQAQINVLQQAMQTITQALAEFTNKKIEVNMGDSAPEIVVNTPKPEMVEYDIQYGQTGRITKIVETPKS